MLDSTAAIAAERQGKTARQLLQAVALKSDGRSNLTSNSPDCSPRRTNRWPEPSQRCVHPIIGSTDINRAHTQINWTFDRKTARRKFGYRRKSFRQS